MNKTKLTLLTAICIATAFTFLACEEKGEGAGSEAKLLESIIYDDGSSHKFEYDAQNRISKIYYYNDGMQSTETLTYSGTDLVKLERGGQIYASDAVVVNFARKGNAITFRDSDEAGSDPKIMVLDKDGYIMIIESGPLKETFQYKDGNLIKSTYSLGATTVTEFKNDNKKSPFFHCNTPKWFLQYHFRYSFGFSNNITEKRSDGINAEVETRKYEYDSDGFPIKTTTRNPHLSDKDMITYFKYRSGTSIKESEVKAAPPPPTPANYSPALQTHYPKGTLGEAGKTRPVEMFFQKVLKNENSYVIVGKSKTKAAEDSFSGTLSVSSSKTGGTCPSGETEIKGSYDLNEKKSNTSGRFAGSFTACEKSGKLSKASFKGHWIKHSNGSKTPCDFGI
jgi:hypothetical protein